MPRKCTICHSEMVEAVNSLIGHGVSYRNISKQIFGDENKYQAIYRHSDNCLGFDVQKAIVAKQLDSKVEVYKEFQEQLEFARGVREKAINYLHTHPEDFTSAVRVCNDAIRTADKAIDRFAKIEGIYREKQENLANLTLEQRAMKVWLEHKDKDNALEAFRDYYLKKGLSEAKIIEITAEQ